MNTMNEITLGMALYQINKDAKRSNELGQKVHATRLYRAKEAVIKKLSGIPIECHSFPIGNLYLYCVDGFSFHSFFNNGVKLTPTKKLSVISSTSSLNLTAEQHKRCYDIINEYLDYCAIEY